MPQGYALRTMSPRNALAANATLHCLTGCAMGEVLDSWSARLSDSARADDRPAVGWHSSSATPCPRCPLIKAGLPFWAALSVVSRPTPCRSPDGGRRQPVMARHPRAMDTGLVNPVFWLGMIGRPVRRVRRRLPGQPLPDRQGQGPRADPPVPARRPRRGPGNPRPAALPTGEGDGMNTNTLAAALAGFLLGGLVVSIAAELEDQDAAPPAHGASVVHTRLG